MQNLPIYIVYNAGMGVEPEPLPDASVFISEIEEMLRGGGKPLESEIPSSGMDEKFYLGNFFINRFPLGIPVGPPREEAEKLFKSFPELKKVLIEELERKENTQEANIVRGITLGKLAEFAGDRFEESAKAKGRAVGNAEFYRLSTVADYWSRLEEITRSAAELQN